MKKKKKRNWLTRITGIACAAVMAGSVLFVNTNSASRAYASDVSTEDTDTAVSSEEVVYESAAAALAETDEISLAGEQTEASEQLADDAQIAPVSDVEVQAEDAAYSSEQEADISYDEPAAETEAPSTDEVSDEAADTVTDEC